MCLLKLIVVFQPLHPLNPYLSIFFADPHPLNLYATILYKKGGGRGASATAIPTLSHSSLSSLNATLMRLPSSVANKRLTGRAKPFRRNTYTKPGGGPTWSYHYTGTLPRLISFLCHSHESTGGVRVFFPFWFTALSMADACELEDPGSVGTAGVSPVVSFQLSTVDARKKAAGIYR